jgi:PIN domain nuclease of toxin-antitoxin system
MRLLLDTHAFLWFVLNDPQLSAKARLLMVDPANDLLLSPATYWEIAIKISIGKYSLPTAFESFMDQQILVNDLEILPIAVKHAAVVATLPFHHRDPFDRLLIAQALAEQIPIISGDSALDAYSVTRLW